MDKSIQLVRRKTIRDLKHGYEIMITNFCNNNCKFCLIGDKFKRNEIYFYSDEKQKIYSLKKSHMNISKLKEEMKNGLKKGYQKLTFAGTEPTIHPQFFSLIKIAKNMGYKRIKVVTNGRMFSDPFFLKKSMAVEIDEIVFSIHGHNAKLHDLLTQSGGSFKQAVKGLKNVISFIKDVGTNTVINKKNYKFLPQISAKIAKFGCKNQQFEFLRIIGNAEKNYNSMVPKISRILPYVKKTIDNAENQDINVRFEEIPFCLHPYPEKCYEDIRKRDINNVTIFDAKFHKKLTKCKKCIYYNKCFGPWKKYIEKEGTAEFVPITKDEK